MNNHPSIPIAPWRMGNGELIVSHYCLAHAAKGVCRATIHDAIYFLGAISTLTGQG